MMVQIVLENYSIYEKLEELLLEVLVCLFVDGRAGVYFFLLPDIPLALWPSGLGAR